MKLFEWKVEQLRSASKFWPEIALGINSGNSKNGMIKNYSMGKNFHIFIRRNSRCPLERNFFSYYFQVFQESELSGQNKGSEKKSSDTVFASFFNQYSGHSVNTLKTCNWSRKIPVTRKWLEKAIGSGI